MIRVTLIGGWLMEERRIDWFKLGNRISEMRLARGVTQMELAEKTLSDLKFRWYAIERHFNDALSRCKTNQERG